MKNYKDWKISRKDNYYYRGEWGDDIFDNSIAIVGSRKMTRYGKDMVDLFVSDFVASGVTTISGFMYGVDTEVHQRTVDYGGKTAAVFGCGLDYVYPSENEKLYMQILEKGGVVISEYPKHAKPHLWKFPQRNKIVAGLSSRGILVIEAGLNSGSLITAELGRKLGKGVYAIPGPINSTVSAGCNELIKTGKAMLVTSSSDILGINSGFAEKGTSKFEELNGLEKRIYELLENESLTIDELSIELSENIVNLGTAVSLMSMKNLIEESGGKYYKKGK